jgi:Ca2+-transporting ATPase
VARRYAEHGPNALAKIKGRSSLSIFVHQFRSLIVGLLVAAGGVALVLGEHVEAVAILIVIVLNAAIGFLAEWKAEQALVGLRNQTVPVALVVRDGAEDEIPAVESPTRESNLRWEAAATPTITRSPTR